MTSKWATRLGVVRTNHLKGKIWNGMEDVCFQMFQVIKLWEGSSLAGKDG